MAGGHPSKVVKLPIMSPGVLSRTDGDCVVNCYFSCNQWSYLVVKHLRYHVFNNVVPVNRICAVMSCLEIDVGKSHEIAFSMTVQKDLQCQSLKSSLRHSFFTERDKMVKACDAEVT